MSEKIVCPACSRKYLPGKSKVCPGCHLSQKDAQYYISHSSKTAEGQVPSNIVFEPYTGLESQDLRDDINRLSSAIGTLATGIFSMVLLTVAGGALIAGGTANAVSCALTGDSCGGATILWGQICLGVGVLSGIVASVRAMTRSSLR